MPRANPSVESALGTLKRAASGGKTAQPVLDTLEALSSSLALLNSSSPSHSSLQSLIALLRAPFVPLYVNYLDQSLYLTLAICKKVMNSNILPALTDSSSITDKQPIAENRHEWEQVLHSLFSGILDFLDNYNTETAKTTIARILYPPLCEYFFPRQSKPVAIETMGVTIRRTAYSLLSDTLAFCPENQIKLNDSRTLGPKRLGMTITRTTDFACLENLLTILAQLLPSSTRSKKRTSFLRDVFLNRNKLSRDCSNEIIRVLERSSGSNWEAASVEIIDILARHDSSFPQPFSTKKLVVCGQLCEQPAIGDRVYMDRHGFFINIRVDDDLYESLQAPYRTVKNVTFSPSLFKNAVQISILLSEVPRMGDQQMKHNSQTRCKPSIIADIDRSKVGYFLKIANKRSLSHILNHQDIGKLQTRVSLSVMSTPLGNLNSPHVEAKLQEMESFYHTIGSSGKGGLKTPQGTHTNVVDNSPCVSKSNEAIENPNNQINLGASLITNVHPPKVFAAENLKDARQIVKPSASLLLRQSVFGKEDEEISEIESFDSPTRFTAKTRRDQGEKDLDDTVPTPRCDVSNELVKCNQPMKSTSTALKNASKCQSRVVMSNDEFSNREVPDPQAEDKTKTRKTHTVDSITSTAVNTAHHTEHSILTDNSSGSDNILLSTKSSAATTADKTSILKDALPVLTSDSGFSFPGSDHDNRSHPYMNTVAITELGRTELDGFSTSEDVTMIDDSSKSLDTSVRVDNLSELPNSNSKKRKHHMIYKEENKNIDPQGTKKASVGKTRPSLFDQIYSTTANARRSQRLGSKVSPQAIRTPERGLSEVSTGAAIGVGPNKSQFTDRRQPNSFAPTLSSAKDIPRQHLSVIDLTEEKNVGMVDLSQSPSMENSSVMEQGYNTKNSVHVSKAALTTRFPENRILPAQHRVAFDPIVQYRQASAQIASSANNDLVPTQKRKPPVQTQPTHNRQTREGQSLNHEPQMDDFVRVLDDIQRAIVDNFTRKSTAVRADIRIARDTMLRDATDDLGKMREKSVKDLKSLICLESKYVHLAHNLSVSYEAMNSVNGEISDQIQQVIHAHDRTSLSRAMPTSLFSTDLPPVFCSSD